MPELPEIRITPHVDLREIQAWEKHLATIEQQMARIASHAQKLQIPLPGQGGGGAGGGPAGSAGGSGPGAPGPGKRTVRSPGPASAGAPGPSPTQATTTAFVTQHLPQTRARLQRQAASSSGAFLTEFQDIIQPILPELYQLMKVGGAPAVQRRLAAHTQSLQGALNEPQGSFNWTQQVGAYAQQAGVEWSTAARHATRAQQWEAQQGRALTPDDLFRAWQTMPANAGGGAGAGGRGSAGGSGGGNLWGRLLGAAGFGEFAGLVGDAAGVGAAAVGIGYVANQTRQGWQTYQQQGTAFSALAKSVGDLGESFNQLRTVVNATGLNFAETLPQITQVIQTLVPYTGNLGTAGLARYLTAVQGFAFAYGLNPTTVAQAVGSASQIGLLPTSNSAGAMSAPQFMALVANAVAAGGMQGRQGQVLSALLGVTTQLAQQLGQAPNANLIAAMMTGLNASGNAALQGTLGAAVLGTINQGIQSPGLGAAGQLATYQALNPTGKLGYFQEQYLQSQGINGVNPLTGTSNFAAILRYFQRMLPGGKVTGTMRHGVWLPAEQTATVATLMGADLGLSPTMALNVLRAFQGKSLTAMNLTTALAHDIGPHALETIVNKGGINVLAGIAHATGVTGPQGLNAWARQITHTLHGHVSPAYERLAQQYERLGRVHPTTTKQAQDLRQQRAEDLAQMKLILGKSIAGGPTLATSLDKLNTTMAKANAQWAKIGRDLQPIAHFLAQLNRGVATGIKNVIQNPLNLISPSKSPFSSILNSIFGINARTSAYIVPGMLNGSSTTQLGATLASFVQGNQQSTWLNRLTQRVTGGRLSPGSGSGSRYVNASLQLGGGSGSAVAGVAPGVTPGPSLTKYMAMANAAPAFSPGVTYWNPTIRKLLGQVAHRNPHLTTALIDAVMKTQDAAGDPSAYYVDSPTQMDAGLMQIDTVNWAKYGLTRDPFNATANLRAGIEMLNQLLNQYHGNVWDAARAYAGSGPAANQDATVLVNTLQQIERNTRQTARQGQRRPVFSPTGTEKPHVTSV